MIDFPSNKTENNNSNKSMNNNGNKNENIFSIYDIMKSNSISNKGFVSLSCKNSIKKLVVGLIHI